MSLLYNWILNYSYYFIHWSRGHYYYNIILQNYVLLSADSFAILYIHILTWRRLLHLCTVYSISWVIEYLHDMIHTMNWGLQANPPPPWFIMPEITSMGTGNTMVLLFSADILFRVCRYRSWNIHLIYLSVLMIMTNIYKQGPLAPSYWHWWVGQGFNI